LQRSLGEVAGATLMAVDRAHQFAELSFIDNRRALLYLVLGEALIEVSVGKR